MSKIINFLSNLLLFALIIAMIFFMLFSWGYSLNINSVPENFIASGIISSFREQSQEEIVEEQTLSFVLPLKIAINENGVLSASIYDKLKTASIYDEINVEFYERLDISNLSAVDKNVYIEAFSNPNFVYMEFLSPISAIYDINSMTYVSEVLILENEILIKSYDEYFSIKSTPMQVNSYDYLDKNAYFKDINGEMMLVSDSVYSGYELEISEINASRELTDTISTRFSYNPIIVGAYPSVDGEIVYVNDEKFSELTISGKEVDFISYEPRGNIFVSDHEKTYSEMISESVMLFNQIYTDIGSSITARPSDIYSVNGQVVIALDGEINGVIFDYGKPFGIFVFTNNSLSNSEIILLNASVSSEVITPQKSSSIYTNSNFVLRYNENGKLQYKMKSLVK